MSRVILIFAAMLAVAYCASVVPGAHEDQELLQVPLVKDTSLRMKRELGKCPHVRPCKVTVTAWPGDRFTCLTCDQYAEKFGSICPKC